MTHEILELKDLRAFLNLYEKDYNGREINVYKLKNVQFFSSNIFYPDVLLTDGEKIISPINEKILSLKNVSTRNNSFLLSKNEKIDNTPYFFLIYNTENYYHFIYDTLPYLISFFELKKTIPDLKILMNYPNFEKKHNYRFVYEFFEILSIVKKDITIVDSSTIYGTLFVSNSYTHDGKSHLPPRDEIYTFYEKIVLNVLENNDKTYYLPENIYISRRTWVTNDTSNIGTNYTTRRRLVNEDDVVEYFKEKGYVEIFSEILTTAEKILLFNSAKNIVGPIGGGLVNVLFSNRNTNLKILNSPNFFDINGRFEFSFKKVNYDILNISSHVETGTIKKFMRVKFDDKIGEVIDINDDIITINYSDINVAGWNNDIVFKKINKKINEVEKLDDGLNSEWKIDLIKLKQLYD